MKVGKDSRPVVSYSDFSGTGNTLWVAKCGNAACTSGNVRTMVDSNTAVGRSNSLAIGKDPLGLPTVSYSDGTNADLKVLKCSNAACSDIATNKITAVDFRYSVGGNNSIAIPDDDIPVIGYVDASFKKFRALKCADSACSIPVGSSSGFTNNDPLIVNGSVIGTTADFNRQLSDNTLNPAEIIQYDPKYLDLFRNCLGENYSFRIREYKYSSAE
jgi:hypothetical protein